MTVISWDAAKVKALREAYDEAVKARVTAFTFTEYRGTGFFQRKVADHPMSVAYAKYLLEYLELELAKQPPTTKQPYNEGEEGQ